MYDTSRLGECAKRRASAAGVDTQEKSAVRKSLIRWKTVRFSIEDRVIALSVFTPDRSDNAKLGKSFNHANSTRDYLYIRFFNLDCHVYRCLTKWESISVVPILMNI